jgi:hypothetical protein
VTTHVLRGSKQEIAERLLRISGDVHEAIVFEDDPAATPEAAADATEHIFAEMQPYEVESNTKVDDSREAIYTRMEGE